MARERRKCLGKTFVLGALVQGLGAWPAVAEDSVPAAMDSAFQQIIVYTINQRYDSALAACRQLESRPGGLAYAFFFKAAVLQTRMLDYDDRVGEEDFFAASQQARQLFKRQLRANPRSATSHFFIGATHAYEAFYFAKRSHLIDGFRSGWLCLQELYTALHFDPKLYDAYLGIGTFKYYQAKLGKAFSWLPLVEDNREAAIQMIRQAIYSGKYSRQAAINGLSWILLEENRPAETLALVDSALAEFPRSRFFLWGAASANTKLERWTEAQRLYELILETFAEEEHPSPYNELVCALRLAEIHFNQAEYAECRRLVEEILAKPLDEELLKRSQKLIERAKEVQEEVENYN